MRCALVVIPFLLPAVAMAQQQPDPAMQAVQARLGQCIIAETAAPVQIKALQDQLAAEKKRADDAEAKLKEQASPK